MDGSYGRELRRAPGPPIEAPSRKGFSCSWMSIEHAAGPGVNALPGEVSFHMSRRNNGKEKAKHVARNE